MISGVLQDWTTQRADAGSVLSIVQGEETYLETSEFDDLVLFLDVREVSTTATVSLAYETSVSPDDASFVATFPAFALSVSTTPRVDRVLAAYASVPVARYVRWHLTTTQSSGSWDVCFRITFAGYAPGA